VALSRIADHVGRVLGDRYRLVAPVGTGASAHVFVAEDVRLRRRVAVKILHPALAEDESFLRRFRAEAQAVAALTHPHIMRVYDWGEDADGPYLVLELLSGGSLRDLLDRGHLLTPAQCARVGLEAARGLEHAHRRGLVHRDVKPANLLFDDEGRLRVADFGVARALAEAAWTEPAGAVLGTARYAAPEQAMGSSVDGRADVYALSLVLVEATTGAVPFAADTTIATLMARVDRPLEAPRHLGPIGPILERAAAPDLTKRLDAPGFASALERAAASLPAPEPLPLAWSTAGDDLSELRDPTELGRATARTRPVPPRPTADDGGRRARRGKARRAQAEAGALAAGSEAGDTAPKASEREASGGSVPRWLRWGFLGAVAVLVGALVAIGALRVATPAHAVPAVVGQDVVKARAILGRDHFRVQVHTVFDEQAADGVVLREDPTPSTKLKERHTVTLTVSKGAAPRAVPNISGLNKDSASKAISNVGLNPKVQGAFSEDIDKGVVIDWSPKDGLQPKNSDVTVVVSDGPRPRTIPDVSNQTYDAASKQLQGIRLTPQRHDDFSDTVAVGQVIGTTPPAGTSVARDSTVTVSVSKGPDLVPVPDVRGHSVDEANTMLTQAGLSVANVYGPSKRGVVFFTDPPAGQRVHRGSGVNLYTI
jgi:serine/threonine-protein kinase